MTLPVTGFHGLFGLKPQLCLSQPLLFLVLLEVGTKNPSALQFGA